MNHNWVNVSIVNDNIMYFNSTYIHIWWHSLIDQVRQLPIIGSDGSVDSWAGEQIDDRPFDDGPIQDLPEGKSVLLLIIALLGFVMVYASES